MGARRGVDVVLVVLLTVLTAGGATALSPWQDDGVQLCNGLWSCVRRDVAADLSDILSADQFNVTPVLAVERIRPASPGALQRMATNINEGGLPTLAATAIKLFETHALVWKLWPGYLHFKVFQHPGEGMDAALEIPPNTDGRTWGAIAARRRITMALLPIMYKMGVGTTLLGVLTFIAVKTMFMVSILFVLAVSSFAKHKLSALAGGGGGVTYLPYPPSYHHHPQKEVHVHVHADPHKQAYGGWHRHTSHHHGPVESPYHPVYSSAYPSSYHSGPAMEESGHLESEPYYHRRVGAVGGGLPSGVAGSPLGSMAALGLLGNLGALGGTLGSLGSPAAHHAHPMSRWEQEPAYYTGSYS